MTTAFRIITVFTIILLAVAPPPINALNPRKLDDTTVGSPNDEIKCGACPCGTTCYASPPPPVPSPPPPSPPPPPKKQNPALCPPPPYGGGGGGGGGSGSGKAPPSYIYISGPPGDLYPVVQSISAAGRCLTAAVAWLVTCGLVGMIAFW